MPIYTYSHPLVRFGVGLALALTLGGCSLDKPQKKVIKDCVLAQDQAATLIGRWRITPIPIAVHTGDFTAQERQIISAAADTWNQFYASSLGLAAVDTGGGSVRESNAIMSTNWCNQNIIGSGNSFTGNIMIYKRGTWDANNSGVIAWTHQCPIPAAPIPLMINAVMEVNYQNYFVAGRKIPDLKTIIIHEIGHVLGLDHSCEPGSTKTGMPNCRSADIPSSYISANMFPSFSFDASGWGEVRQNLNENDQGRANCLYGSSE